MNPFVTKYKYECITAALCGSVCLAIMVLPVAGEWYRWWPFGGGGSDSRVEVSQVVTGRVLMRGSSVREAVETRLARIRKAVAEAGGHETEAASFSSIAATLPAVPIEQAGRLYGMLKSFYGADLNGADLHGLDFRGINLQYADFTNANLAEAQLDGAQTDRACFANANLTEVRFGTRPDQVPDYRWPAGGNAPGALFHRCNLENAILNGRFSGASFKGANLRGAKFRLWSCERLDLRGADLTGASIQMAPTAVPDTSQNWDSGLFYSTVQYDEETRVEGLGLSGVSNPGAPFVQWALNRGAVLVELPPAPELEPAAPVAGPPEGTPPS